MIKLNTESPIAKALWELAFQIAKHDSEKIAEEELKKKVEAEGLKPEPEPMTQ
jgi:hypothetical protein